MNTHCCKQILFFSFTLFLLILSYTSFSQVKKKAFEISTYNFDQFSVRYKFGNEKHLFRISTFTLNTKSSHFHFTEEPEKKLRAGLGFGIEYPKQINEKLSFYYGPELRGSFYKYKFTQDTHHYSASIRGILGFSYYFNETISLSAEIDPGFLYNYDSDDNQDITKSLEFNFLTYGAAIVLGFNF